MSNKFLLTVLTGISLLLLCYTSYNYFRSRNINKRMMTIQPIFYDSFGNLTAESQVVEEVSDEDIDVTYITTNIMSTPEMEQKEKEEEEGFVTHSVTSHEEDKKTGKKKRQTSFTQEDYHLLMLNDTEAWRLLTNGLFTEYPTIPYGQIKSQIQEVYNSNYCEIEVPIWYWENPSDDTNFKKITKTKKWVVNSAIAETCKHIFSDIYNDPSQPIINIADSAMGTWALRGKMHSDARTVSAHALGASFDINPSTGTFNVNGIVYGNGYGNDPMPKEVWYSLPQSHKKYNVLYKDCPVVKIFKAYGFYWGGDWNSGKDCMHLAFLGDGGNAREIGQQNYRLYHY